MSQPVWQSNYVDLCEESTVRFGGACVVCSARYATPVEAIARELVLSAAPGSPLAQELADLKFQRFTEFDNAFRELSITCYRCGRAACPDCWDDDNRMCAECVVARGLTRSPRVGPPGRSPLQDGRLERVAAGRHSDVGRPAWLNHLLETEAARVGHVPPAAPPAPRLNDAKGPSMPGEHDGFDVLASPAPAMPTPFAPADPGRLAGEPTNRMPTPGPTLGIGDEPMGWGLAQMEAYDHERFETSEGSATSNMVSCPRCGTANYDFVTRCTVCQLQLIQICPACEKLNAGHVKACEFCGASLKQPQGWSGVQEAIKPVPPEEVSQKRRAATPMPMPLPMPAPITPDQFMPPMPPMPPMQAMSEPRPRLRKTAPQARSTGVPAMDAVGAQPAAPAAFAMPAMPALGPFEAPAIAPPQPRARRSRGAMDTLINGAERMASLVLVAIILVIVGGIVAAEVSAKADAFIASLIHIDIRVTIAHFLQQMQRLINRNS